MSPKDFLYAALCNFGGKGKEKAQKYIEENPKDEFTCDDWIAVFYSDPEPIKTGKDRPLMRPICDPNNHGYTTRQWS